MLRVSLKGHVDDDGNDDDADDGNDEDQYSHVDNDGNDSDDDDDEDAKEDDDNSALAHASQRLCDALANIIIFLARNARFRTVDFSTAMLECHPVKHSNGSSSAEKPVLTARRVRLCARAENTRVKKCRKTACAVDDTTKIAFISCGLNFAMILEDDPARLQKIVTEMFNHGCLMFALSFEQTGDAMLVKRQLQDTLSHLAQTTVCSCMTENSITLWTESFGSLCLTKHIESKAGTHLPTPIELQATGTLFETKAGRLFVISTVWSEMDTWTIAEALHDFFCEIDKSVQAVFVGGALQCPFAICENVISKFYSPIEFVVSGAQAVFIHTLQHVEARSTAIHISDDVSSLLVQVHLASPRQTRFTPPLPAEPPPPLRATPLYDLLLNNLRNHAPQLLAYVSEQCFHGKLLTKNFFGDTLAVPMRLSVKMEELLGVCQARRDLHIGHLRKVGDPRCSAEQPEADNLIIFNDDDMTQIMTTWKEDVASYMKPATQRKFRQDLKRNVEKARNKCQSVHSTHLFQISGCKFIVHLFIRMPVLSECAEQPVIDQLLQDYERHKESDEYKKVVAHSQNRSEAQWWGEHEDRQGKELFSRVRKVRYAGAGASALSRLPVYG